MTALLLTACSEESATVGQTEDIAAAENVIVLGVKEVVAPETRAEQQKGSIDFTKLTETGFGVYGYEGSAAYDSSTKEYNLFPPNTPVSFIAGGKAPTTSLDHPGSWEYSSTKTWTAGKKYTFFAYAPYMAEGGTAPGITSVSAGNGDPTIGYTVAEDPASSVDLLWGVRTDTSDKSGKPWIDVQKGQTASAVLFTFYHALCAVGFHAQVIVDQKNDHNNLDDISKLGTLGKADGCKVTLKSITITPIGFPNAEPAVAATRFHKSAKLNLNNTTAHQPLWQDHSETISSLVLDGGEIDQKLLDPHTDEQNTTTGYEVMTNTIYDDEVPGITESANSQTVIAGNNLYMLIPQASQDYTVTVEYFVTYKTETGYNRQKYTGTATIKNLELVAGVKYYINLVLGLTTFKVTVDANDWTEETQNTTVAIETGTSASQSLAKQSTLVFE